VTAGREGKAAPGESGERVPEKKKGKKGTKKQPRSEQNNTNPISRLKRDKFVVTFQLLKLRGGRRCQGKRKGKEKKRRGKAHEPSVSTNQGKQLGCRGYGST